MKNKLKLILTLCTILCAVSLNTLFGQYTTSYLSYSYTEVLSYSLKITYSIDGSYKSSNQNFSYSNALNTLQARFDYNKRLVEIEYGKLLDLNLINKSNKKTLQEYKSKIKQEVETKGGRADFSKSSVTQEWINYVSQPFRHTTIKDEIEK